MVDSGVAVGPGLFFGGAAVGLGVDKVAFRFDGAARGGVGVIL